MLFTTNIKMHLGAIALFSLFVNIPLSLNAQTTTSDNISFEDIEAGKDGSWSFSSEDETTSIQDNLEQLRDYDISSPYDSEVKLKEEERRWGNTGDRPDYTLETEVYNY